MNKPTPQLLSVALCVAVAAAAGACSAESASGAATTKAAGTGGAEALGHLVYTVAIDAAPAAGALSLQRGWVTVAALTATPCLDVAALAPPSVMQAIWRALRRPDWLISDAYAGHSEAGLPAWQVVGSHVYALHQAGDSDYGLASETAEALCGLHLLLGRAEQDAPTLAELPQEVTMARMTLHLELVLADGSERVVRTDVGWGRIAEVVPSLPTGDGTAAVTLHPGAALDVLSAAGGVAAMSDKDLGRAFLVALLDGATVAFSLD